MANVAETPTYDAGIYQLEITDQVLGGAAGVSNNQAKGLANRTAYLKVHVDEIENFPQKFKSIVTLGATAALVAATHYSALLKISGTSGNIVLTLPASATGDNKKILSFVNKGAYNVTITADGSDTIDGSASIILLPGDWVRMALDFASTTFIVEASKISTSKISSQTNNTTASTSSTAYSNIAGMSYSVPAGSARDLLIVAKVDLSTIGGSANTGFLQLWDGTNELGLAFCGDAVNVGAHSMSVCYYGSVAGGTTLTLRHKNSVGTSVDYNNASMSIIER